MINHKCEQTKMKWPRIFFSPLLSHAYLQYLSFALLETGVSTTAWLRCSVGTSLDWFCRVKTLLTFCKTKENSPLRYV